MAVSTVPGAKYATDSETSDQQDREPRDTAEHPKRDGFGLDRLLGLGHRGRGSGASTADFATRERGHSLGFLVYQRLVAFASPNLQRAPGVVGAAGGDFGGERWREQHHGGSEPVDIVFDYRATEYHLADQFDFGHEVGRPVIGAGCRLRVGVEGDTDHRAHVQTPLGRRLCVHDRLICPLRIGKATFDEGDSVHGEVLLAADDRRGCLTGTDVGVRTAYCAEVNVAVETKSGRRMLDVWKASDRIDDRRVVPGPLAEGRIIKPG